MTTYRILAAAALVAAIFVAGWKFGADRVNAKWNTERITLMQAAATAEKSARETENRLSRKITEAQNAATEREKTLRLERDTARAAARSLREQTSTAARRINLPDAPGVTIAEYAIAAGELLAECSAALTELGEKADGHASDVLTLKAAWPSVPH